METQDILNSKSLKRFIKGSFVIIGLFAVLSFGIATLVLYYNDFLIDKAITLILIIAFFILFFLLIIYFSFYYLVNDNYKKLYEDLYIKNEEYKQKIDDMEKLIKYILR
jgi:uncharacterized BrkB/YihY/UPF0761 family membrane protein